jgi:hypothetical protein
VHRRLHDFCGELFSEQNIADISVTRGQKICLVDSDCPGARLARRANARLGVRRRSPLGSARVGVPAMESAGKAALGF